jgi:protein CWC15
MLLNFCFIWVYIVTYSQAGQTSTSEVKKQDLRAELLEAEMEARNKKRKAEGKPLEEAPRSAGAITAGGEDEEANKRRKLLQQALEMDKDEDSDSDDEEGGKDKESGEGEGDKPNGKGKEKDSDQR